MNIKVIGDFRFAVEDALQMLSGMAKKYHSLPTENELNAMIERLKKCGTYEVVASILEDANYRDNKDVYLRAFGGVLSYEVFGGVLADDNSNTFDFWQGMTGKIKESNAVAPSDYPDKVAEISGYVGELIKAMKKDLAEIFGEVAKTDEKRTQGRKKGIQTNRREEREVKETDFPTEKMNGIDETFRLNNAIYSAVKRCLYGSVDIKYLRTALLTCCPEAIANGNRLEILAFLFRKFAEGYINDEGQRKEYLTVCQRQFEKIKSGYNFNHAAPNREIQGEIWSETEKKFKKMR